MRTLAALSILLAAIGCTPDTAQHAHPRPADAEPSRSQTLASQDRDFLERAATGGNAEIAIGGLVDDRTQNADVLALGHMIVADHVAANERLRAIATAKHIALPQSLGEHQAGFDRVADERDDPFDRDFMRVMVEDHQQALELFRAEATNGTDPALKAFAASTLPMLEKHYQRSAGVHAG